jgi:hypothetical protein
LARAHPPNASRWSMAASAICSMRTCRGCAPPRASARPFCALHRTLCIRCRSLFRRSAVVARAAHSWEPARACTIYLPVIGTWVSRTRRGKSSALDFYRGMSCYTASRTSPLLSSRVQ